MKYVDKEYTNGDVEYASGNGEINFYDKNKSKVGTFSTGYPIIEYYQLTKDYYLIDSYEGINDYHVYLNNKDNTTLESLFFRKKYLHTEPSELIGSNAKYLSLHISLSSPSNNHVSS